MIFLLGRPDAGWKQLLPCCWAADVLSLVVLQEVVVAKAMLLCIRHLPLVQHCPYLRFCDSSWRSRVTQTLETTP